jgi:hypothetical protein
METAAAAAATVAAAPRTVRKLRADAAASRHALSRGTVSEGDTRTQATAASIAARRKACTGDVSSVAAIVASVCTSALEAVSDSDMRQTSFVANDSAAIRAECERVVADEAAACGVFDAAGGAPIRKRFATSSLNERLTVVVASTADASVEAASSLTALFTGIKKIRLKAASKLDTRSPSKRIRRSMPSRLACHAVHLAGLVLLGAEGGAARPDQSA